MPEKSKSVSSLCKGTAECTLGEEGSGGGFLEVGKLPRRIPAQWVAKMGGGSHPKCGIPRNKILEVVLTQKNDVKSDIPFISGMQNL